MARCYIGVMRDDFKDRRREFRWTLPASLVLHSLVAAYLIFDLPISLRQPQKEEAIEVELVAPPEPPDEAKAQADEPNAEKPKQAKEKKSPSAPRDPTSPTPVLRPVFHFGEKDTGPRASPEGNSAEKKLREAEAGHSSESEDSREAVGRSEEAQRDFVKGETALPAVPPPLAATQVLNQVPEPVAPETQAPKAESGAKGASVLEKAKTLFSPDATGSRIATTAMGNLPRDERISQLCASELAAQLRNAWPPFFPEFVPNIQLKEGTILDVPEAAFRANKQWYDLSYRCEVDEDAKKVVSFALRVGDPISKEEGKRRGLPGR